MSYEKTLKHCPRYQSIDQVSGYLNSSDPDNPMCASCLFKSTRDCVIQDHSNVQMDKTEETLT